ncbi:MAG: hypothetical protein IJI56_01285 [Firmicutes bacterium]|nr:hypothetical protein [Bacillota bacterium]
MTGPVNVYALSRIRDEEAFNIVKRHQSRDNDKRYTQLHEMGSLRLLVDALVKEGVGVWELDSFFFGYNISRIGKEFDLLRVTDKYCLNIELKSMEVPKSQILDQLRKNRYYLNLLGKRQELFTVVTDTMECWKLSMNDELAEADISEIVSAVKRTAEGCISEIDSLFKPSNYLVSPMNTPERFIQGEYFLTQAQAVIKKELMNAAEKSFSGAFFHLTGKPGTGKTLLLYDAARSFAKNGRTLVVHCGALQKGQLKIREEVENLDIRSSEEMGKGFPLKDFHFILTDETCRMEPSLFEEICSSAVENCQVVIFSTDPQQVLSSSEKEHDIAGRIEALDTAGEYKLSDRIRTNKELWSFILRIMDLDNKPKGHTDYGDVRINYAGNAEEARLLLEYYRKAGYTFINYTRASGGVSPFAEFEEDFDTHSVIGREFDSVVMLMDSSFYYDEKGRLQGVPSPGTEYIYPNLFYQGITRVREKLALIVVEAPELFRDIASIFED